MNIVIAGAGSYLGTKLVEQLCILPNKYIQQSDVLNMLLILRDKTNLPEILRFRENVIICDINSNSAQNQIIDFNPDIIFCSTCCYETDPKYLYKIIDANYVFPARLLQIAASMQKTVRFISIGTSLPKLLNLYSLTKKHFVELGVFFQQLGKINFVNLALESFYGINEPENRFITKSILRLKANQDLLLTEGSQKRDFIFIDDVIEILLFLITVKDNKLLSESEHTISVGTGIAPSIREIILFLHKELNSKSNLKFGAVKMRKNEPSTCAELSVLRNLGFSKTLIHWQDGMRKVIEGIA